MIDPIQYYDLERFLLTDVRSRFSNEGWIGAFDFFSIIIWKSNRSKSKVAQALRERAKEKELNQDLESIAKTISSAVWKATDEKEKMRVLFWDWKFRLPIASAILTILYPDTFTVYDYRAAQQIDCEPISTGKFEKLWIEYTDFRRKVMSVPHGKTLRQKDIYLFGKSRHDDLVRDLQRQFRKNE